MEDAHAHFLSLKQDKDASFFAVYDGHGGELDIMRAKSGLLDLAYWTDANERLCIHGRNIVP